MKLTVGTDSTWSLRAWICSELAQLDIEINVINLTSSGYKTKIFQHSKTGLVPALSQDGLNIHDSLAIAEYFNECAQGRLYPHSQHERALARSFCLELHSGFTQLRANFPFSIESVEPLKALNNDINDELSRVESIFETAQLPFMFDSPGVVDAFYAILAFRLKSYGISFQGKAGAYQESLLNWSILQQAISLAKSWKNI